MVFFTVGQLEIGVQNYDTIYSTLYLIVWFLILTFNISFSQKSQFYNIFAA